MALSEEKEVPFGNTVTKEREDCPGDAASHEYDTIGETDIQKEEDEEEEEDVEMKIQNCVNSSDYVDEAQRQENPESHPQPGIFLPSSTFDSGTDYMAAMQGRLRVEVKEEEGVRKTAPEEDPILTDNLAYMVMKAAWRFDKR